MKLLTILGALLAAIGAGLLLADIPALESATQPLLIAGLVGGVLALVGALMTKPEARETVAVQAARPQSVATGGATADRELVSLLSLLQEKGRFVDFVMDDVTAYSDAQVGAAARVVHQGCQAVLREHFDVQPISQEAEGSAITLPAGYAVSDFRLLGNVSGEAPYQGVVVHKGWRAAKVKVPRVTAPAGHLPNIAPSQVELS